MELGASLPSSHSGGDSVAIGHNLPLPQTVALGEPVWPSGKALGW